MKKQMIGLLSGLMAAACVSTAFAGTWRQDESGWWYQNDDGSYPAGAWQWIDSDGDGTAECYYFYSDGYLAHNNEIDGKYVDEDGRWTSAGKVQHRAVGNVQNTASAAGGSSALAAPNYNNAENHKALAAYESRIRSYNASVAAGYKPEFAVMDIDGNGVYEAEVYLPGRSNADTHFVLLYWENGEMKTLQSPWPNGFTVMPDGYFSSEYIHMGINETIWRMENGTVQEIGEYGIDPGYSLSLLPEQLNGHDASDLELLYELSEEELVQGYLRKGLEYTTEEEVRRKVHLLVTFRDLKSTSHQLVKASAENYAAYLGGDGRETPVMTY